MLQGIALRLAATFLITAMSAVVHALAAEVPVGQIIFWRSSVALVPIVLYMLLKGQFPAALATRRPLAHVTRSLFGALSMAFSFISLAWLPVASAQALAYLAPVLTLPLAAILLGERLNGKVIAAVGIGFGGVAAMLWPALDMPGSGALIGIGAGVGYALTMAFVRVHIKAMTASESVAAIAFYFAVTCTAVGLASLPFGWVDPDRGTHLLLVVAGLLGGLGHIAATEAVARAPVSVLATFDYSGLVWALGFDLVVFSVVPGLWGLLGAGAILFAALLVTLRPARSGGGTTAA